MELDRAFIGRDKDAICDWSLGYRFDRSCIAHAVHFPLGRSGGKRGASIENLRGTSGADFESAGRITRLGEGIGCGCFGPSFDSSDVIILIKGPFVFVYGSETSSSPKYAVSLKGLKAQKKGQEHGRHPVMLETTLGDPQYEFSFADDEAAVHFVDVVKAQSAYADKVEIRKKLGHEHLLSRRASVKFAEQVATQKCKEAPPKPDSGLDQTALNLVGGPM